MSGFIVSVSSCVLILNQLCAVPLFTPVAALQVHCPSSGPPGTTTTSTTPTAASTNSESAQTSALTAATQVGKRKSKTGSRLPRALQQSIRNQVPSSGDSKSQVQPGNKRKRVQTKSSAQTKRVMSQVSDRPRTPRRSAHEQNRVHPVECCQHLAKQDDNQNVVAGVDLGGGSTKFALIYEDSGEILARHQIYHGDARSPEAVVRNIGLGIKTMLEDVGLSVDNLDRVGIGAPGKATGSHVEGLSNFPTWTEPVPISSMVNEQLGGGINLVHTCNDADAALAGECWIGAAKGSGNVCMFTLGTGVGFAAISGKKFVKGATGTIEGGHHPLIPLGRSCACGQSGCMENYCSGAAIGRRVLEDMSRAAPLKTDALYDDNIRAAVRANLGCGNDFAFFKHFIRESSLAKITGRKITSADVFAAAKAGDKYAGAIVQETCMYLAIGVGETIFF